MNGFSFKKDDIAFKSSSIAKNYSWQNLQKNGLNYDHARDTEYLTGVKNEFTQKLNLESGRDRGIETLKSIAERTESTTERAESGIDRSKLSAGETDRTKMVSDRHQTLGYTHHDPIAQFNEITPLPETLETSGKSDPAKLSGEAVYENRHRGKSTTTDAQPRENSGIGKSTDCPFEDNVIFSEPLLNPAPEREPEKNNSNNKDREKSYGNVLSR